ncbi:hypothetical protein Sinac_3892 [Singulisphaera acidiphila DSM 18658]|uniref:Glycosyltransferase RgtA/B/C/D-like domain-containing protein n=2 Tax=Singulisphaera acidiphila TaxID=466153 RepID=L0DGZ1_SINAD|nr:hypothetical protein Sinac_3892 [Singulisphaera acidiphila DSM 18658]
MNHGDRTEPGLQGATRAGNNSVNERSHGFGRKTPCLLVLTAMLITGLSGGTYWIATALRRPNEPSSISLLYRYGDTDYLPLIYSLARLKYREFVVYEAAGTKSVSFPVFFMLPHALMVRLFGDYGFGYADALVAAARFVILLVLVKGFVRPPGATVATALLAFFLTGPGAHRVFGSLISSPVWAFRYPRPYNTSLVFFGLILTAGRFWAALKGQERRSLAYLLHGGAVALAFQGDLHLGIIAGFATLFLLSAALVARPSRVPWFAGLQFAAAFLVCASPFLIQSTQSDPQVVARWGMFPIQRLSPPFLPPAPGSLAIIIALAGAAWWKAGRSETSEAERRTIIVCLALCAASVVAMPLSAILLGRGIQLYHFDDRMKSIFAFSNGICLIITFKSLLSRFRLAPAVLGVVAATAILYQAFVPAEKRAHVETQPRDWPGHGWELIPSYRRNLAKLIRELDTPKYAAAKVLGTFDQQLGLWWMTVKAGYVFVPDTFLSTVSDDEIETRAIELARLVGFDKKLFSNKVQEYYFTNRFLGLGRWQASRAHQGGNDRDYTSAQLKSIRESTVIDNQNTIVPPPEVERLASRFESHVPTKRKLDLIILVNESSYSHLGGSLPGFQKTYANPTFTVYLREPAEAPPSIGGLTRPPVSE